MLNVESNELDSINFCRIEIEQLLICNLLILIKFINSVKVIKDGNYSKHILQKKVFDTFFVLLIIITGNTLTNEGLRSGNITLVS